MIPGTAGDSILSDWISVGFSLFSCSFLSADIFNLGRPLFFPT